MRRAARSSRRAALLAAATVLAGAGAAQAAILQRGPVVTQARADGALVSWRTFAPARASLRIAGREIVLRNATADAAVRIRGLRPGRRYAYALLGDGVVIGRGSLRTSPPATGPVARTRFRAVVFGDYGEAPSGTAPLPQVALARVAAAQRPDLLVTTGDNVYPASMPSRFDPQVFLPLRPLLARASWVVALGNHDQILDDGSAFLDALRLPGAERWYVARYGPAALVVLDTMASMAPGSPQRAFMDGPARAALASACVRLVVGHHPPYHPHSEGKRARLQRDLVPWLEAARVPLVLLGHEHGYERSRPLHGVRYLIVGTGGRRSTRPSPRSDIPVAAAVSPVVGAAVLDIDRQGVRGTFVDTAGAVRDRFSVAAPSRCRR